jgi:hypothetical protein
VSNEAKCPTCGADVYVTDGDLMGVPDTDETYCEECDTALFVQWQPVLVAPEDDENEAPSVTYHLVRNHLNKNASYDGCMFQTFGAEIEFVKQQPRTRVWTLVDCGETCEILAGWHYVNRLGYFVTAEPWTDEHEYYDYRLDVFQSPSNNEGEGQ